MSNQDHVASQDGEKIVPSPSDAEIRQPRILARQLARPLTAEEIEAVAGALAVDTAVCTAGTCCTPDCDC
jgi:hypothetical protein